MNTKLDKVLTYSKNLPSLKPHDLWSRDSLENFYSIMTSIIASKTGRIRSYRSKFNIETLSPNSYFHSFNFRTFSYRHWHVLPANFCRILSTTIKSITKSLITQVTSKTLNFVCETSIYFSFLIFEYKIPI